MSFVYAVKSRTLAFELFLSSNQHLWPELNLSGVCFPKTWRASRIRVKNTPKLASQP